MEPGEPVLVVDGLDVNTPPVVTVSGLSIGNDSYDDGTVVAGEASLTVRNSTISNNSGNGILAYSRGTVTVENSDISHNSETGIVVEPESTATVRNSTISYNASSGVYDLGTAKIVRSAVTGNEGPAGAGIAVSGSLVVADSTVSGNTAANLGGALLNEGTSLVESSTIAHNSSPGSSAIASLNNGVTLAGDVVAEQTAGSDCPAAGVVDDGYNLDDDGSCVSSTSPGEGSHNGMSADGLSTYGAVLDAYLADSLGDNGGPTQTLALLGQPSPATTEPDPALAVVPSTFNLPTAVDAKSAACSVPDQRGVAPAGGIECDVGAYFLQATRTSLSTSSATVPRGGSVTYTATIAPPPDGGTVTFSDGAANPASVNCPARPLAGDIATCTVSYPAAGTFSVTATYSGDGASNDYAGSTSSPPLGQVVTASGSAVPRLSDLRVRPDEFPGARGRASGATARHGAAISYRDTLAARTTLRVLRKLGGVRLGRRCVAAGKAGPAREGKPCQRLVALGSLVHSDKAGPNRLRFAGRVGGHALRPGRYLLKAAAALDGLRSPTISRSFVILIPDA